MSEVNKGGKPSTLTPEVQERIVKVIRKGNYFETAVAYAGVPRSTFYDWLRRGREERDRVSKDARLRVRQTEEKFVNFSIAVEQALAESEMDSLDIIVKASDNNWQASAWRLERRFPDRWGRKVQQQVEHSGSVDITKRAEEIDRYFKTQIDEDEEE